MSKGINHLLKSPLCVHPKTGRICVPIDTKKLNQFNPFDVPTISQICYELDKVKPEHGETKHKQGMKYFSLHHLSLPPFSISHTHIISFLYLTLMYSLHEDISSPLYGCLQQTVSVSSHSRQQQTKGKRSVQTFDNTLHLHNVLSLTCL